MSVTYIKGVGLASAAAGPLFLLASLVTVAPGDTLARSTDWPIALVVALVSMPFGLALAAVPNLLGAALLGRLGRGNDGVRLPVFWALIGAGAGAGIDAAVASVDASRLTPLFTLVALASALLCRAGTRWVD